MQRREENEYPGVLIGGSSQLPTVTQNEENSPSGNPRSTSAVLAGQRVDKVSAFLIVTENLQFQRISKIFKY